MVDDWVKLFATYGLAGLVIVALGIWIWLKDKEWRDERARLIQELLELQKLRVEDAKTFGTLALGMQKETVAATNSIDDMLKETNKMSASFDRLYGAFERNGRTGR